MTTTKKLEKSIERAQNRKWAIERAVRLRSVYAMLKDHKMIMGNEGYCQSCVGDPKRLRRCRHKKLCHQWLSCCTAQGSCQLPPLHKGPHLQRGCSQWTIFSADRRTWADVNEIDIKRLWPIHRKTMGDSF